MVLIGYKIVFPSLEWLQITKSVLWNLAVILVLPYLNNPNDLELSYKMDLDFGIVLEGKKVCLITEEILYHPPTQSHSPPPPPLHTHKHKM